MTGSTATAVVAARLTGVVGATANVWNMLGNPVDEASFKARYANASTIHAYEVTREGSVPDEGKDASAIARGETVVIYGYLAYQDGVSEPIFQAEVDAICAAFDPPSQRSFAAELAALELAANPNLDWSSAPRVEGPRIGKLGPVLVHYVRIVVDVTFSPIF